MADKKQAMWFDGLVIWGSYFLPDPIEFSVVQELKTITHNAGGGAGESSWPTGRKVSGSIQFGAVTAEVMAALTGGALTTGDLLIVRQGEESQTISSNEITLTEAGDVIAGSVKLVGANGTVFKKVSATPAVGEYTYASATGVCTFNVSETETTIYPEYMHLDSAVGQTLTIGHRDVPSEIALYGSLRTKDMNSGTNGDIGIYLNNVNLMGTLEIGGDSGGNTKPINIEYSANIAADGDFKMYFPA